MLGDGPSIGTEFALCAQVFFRVQRNGLQDSTTSYAYMEIIKTSCYSCDLEIA